MNIEVASLTLRFYKKDGWTKAKVKKLLVNNKLEITYREHTYSPSLSYFAIYEKSGYKVFKESEIMKHSFIDKQKFGRIDWYINKEVSNE